MKHVIVPSLLILVAAFLSLNYGITGNAPHQTFMTEKLVGGTSPGVVNVYPDLSYLKGAVEVSEPSKAAYDYLAENIDLYPIGNPDGILDQNDVNVYRNIITYMEPDFARNIGIRPSSYGVQGTYAYEAKSNEDIRKLTRYGLPREGDLTKLKIGSKTLNLDVYPFFYDTKTGEYFGGIPNYPKIDNNDLQFAQFVVSRFGGNLGYFNIKGNECAPNQLNQIFIVQPGFIRSGQQVKGEPVVCVKEGGQYLFKSYSTVYGEPFPEDMELNNLIRPRNIPRGQANIYSE